MKPCPKKTCAFHNHPDPSDPLGIWPLPCLSCTDSDNYQEAQTFANLRDAARDLCRYLRKVVPDQIEMVGTDVAAVGLAQRLTRLENASGLEVEP